MPAPEITVVVPTHSRPAGLARLLVALTHQRDTPADWDVVVVNNASHQDAKSVCALPAFKALNIRVVDEPVPGAGAARNRGVEAASGRVVAFLDDDVVPEATWLAALVARVTGGVVGAGGRVLLDPEVAIPRWIGDGLRSYLAEHDLGDAVARPLTGAEYVLSANAAFTREALIELGGFDSRLGPRQGGALFNDDVDLVHRARALGDVWWEPAAAVIHDLPPERLRPGYLLERQFAQGRSDALTGTHPSRMGGAGAAATRAARTAWPSVRRNPLRPGSAFAIAGETARLAGYLSELWRK